MTAEQRMVLDFHRAFELTANREPTVPSFLDRTLRANLIQEEWAELVTAMARTHVDLSEVADALGDLLYVVYGSAVTFGIDMEPIFAEIHRSNMTKVNPDGTITRRADGKVIKPATYSPVNLGPILAAQLPLFE